jgi:2-oxo-3-hexenedioate decarboxylase
MTASTGLIDVTAVAAEALAALDRGRAIAPFSSRLPHFDLDAAYRVTAEVRRMREARGEVPVGRKIGFTNRSIWDEYNVREPIWGYIYDHTIHDLIESGEAFSLAGQAEPRIEPEIMFGLATAPSPGMDEHALLDCIDWVAHGYEIVQSIFPGWRFSAPDTVAAFGLHGALLIGSRHSIAERAGDFVHSLSSFEIRLERDGAVADRGRAANVLGGPLSALRHLVDLLARDRINPPLAAGEIVTTGTLTRALPVAAGETWTTAIDELPWALRVRFT